MESVVRVLAIGLYDCQVYEDPVSFGAENSALEGEKGFWAVSEWRGC